MANFVSIILSTFIALCTGKGFNVKKELRKPLFIRCIVGLCGLTSFTIGAALTSITVQITIGNLSPFIAGVIAYFVMGELMSKFELTAMFISFGAIIMIGVAQGNRVTEEET